MLRRSNPKTPQRSGGKQQTPISTASLILAFARHRFGGYTTDWHQTLMLPLAPECAATLSGNAFHAAVTTVHYGCRCCCWYCRSVVVRLLAFCGIHVQVAENPSVSSPSRARTIEIININICDTLF